MPLERTDGVSVAVLKTIARRLKGRQDLALALYAAGRMEAMYLAGLIANGAHMTPTQLQDWAENSAGMSMIAEYTTPWVTVENAAGMDLALAWIAAAKDAYVATSGWTTLSGLVAIKPDAALDLEQIAQLLPRITQEIHHAPNRVKYTMNGFLLAVGRYVESLRAEALEAARSIGKVTVDLGDTACVLPNAFTALNALTAEAVPVKKRKTIRC